MKLPPAYELLRAGPVRAAIRRDLVPLVAPWLVAPRFALPPDAERVSGGRGPTYRVALPGGPTLIVRRYRRGGLIARFVEETYVGLRPRPLRELVLTAEARRRGVAAAEVVGARVEGRIIYRGVLVTAEVPAAATLLEALRRAPDAAARRALAVSAGRTVAALHDAGVFHADLNLMNILVHPAPGGDAIALLDFDRARLHAAPLAARPRRRNLRRLARSLAKLDPAGALAGPEERQAFRVAYGTGGDRACGS